MSMFEILWMVPFQAGGLGGLLAERFINGGLVKVLNGEMSLENGLLILVCLLIFIFVYQTGVKDKTRGYDFEKHTRTSRYYDPTLDVDSRKSLEEFQQSPDVKSQYLNYNPKETQDQYRSL